MRYIKIIMISLLIIAISSLQGMAQSNNQLYHIKLKDKENNRYSLENAGEFLSQRSLERRQKQGIQLGKDDLPVSESYLLELEAMGLKPIVVSKWLNTVIASSSNYDLLESIRSKPFVQNASLANDLNNSVISFQEEKPFFANEYYDQNYIPVVNQHKSIQVFDYGDSFNQIDMLNGIELHNNGYTGEGMVIAVLDAGFTNVNQLEAFDNLWDNDRILGSRDYVQPGNDVFAPGVHDHGMSVLSVMGGFLPGSLIGSAPDASYYLIRTEDGSAEYLMEEYFWVMGAEYADSLGVDIINSSLGYTEFDDPEENHTYEDLEGNTTVITIGADKAAEKGILVCNSAGNYADDPWLYIGAPADADSILTVGAVDPEGNWATFSSIGPTSDGRIKPTIVGQGQQTIVAAPWGGIFAGDGTSFSSPLLAGMTACLWQANPDFTNMEVIQALIQSASQYTEPDEYLGYGMPDFQEADNILGVVNISDNDFLFEVEVSPNPFNDILNLNLNIDVDGNIGLSIIDITGREIYNYSDRLNSGKQTLNLEIPSIPSGVYFLYSRFDNRTNVKKILKY